MTETRRYLVLPTPFREPARDYWPRRVGADWQKYLRGLFPLPLQNDDDGAAIGTDNVRLGLTLGPSHSKLTGTFESQIKKYCRDRDIISYRYVLGNPDHCVVQSSCWNYLCQRHQPQLPAFDHLSF